MGFLRFICILFIAYSAVQMIDELAVTEHFPDPSIELAAQ